MSSRRNRYPTAGPVQATPSVPSNLTVENEGQQAQVSANLFQSDASGRPVIQPKFAEESAFEAAAAFDHTEAQTNLSENTEASFVQLPESGIVYEPVSATEQPMPHEFGWQQASPGFFVQPDSFYNISSTTTDSHLLSNQEESSGPDQNYETSLLEAQPNISYAESLDVGNAFFNQISPSQYGQTDFYPQNDAAHFTSDNYYCTATNDVPYETSKFVPSDFQLSQQFTGNQQQLPTDSSFLPNQSSAEYASSFTTQIQHFNPFDGSSEYSQGNLASPEQTFLLPHPMHQFDKETANSFISPLAPQFEEANKHPVASQSFEMEPIQLVSQQLQEAILSPVPQIAFVNCISCHYANDKDANFCCKCGSKLIFSPLKAPQITESIIHKQIQPSSTGKKFPTSLSCILPGGRIVTCRRGSFFISKLKPYWEVSSENSELIQCIVNQKDFKNALKRIRQSQDRYEFESTYLFNAIQEKDIGKLKELFAITHNLPSSISIQPTGSAGSTNLSLETTNFLTNHNVGSLLEQCIATGNCSAALAISYLIGSQDNFISALLATLQFQSPSGMLRIILGIHLSAFSLDLLDQTTVCNWWKEILSYLLRNEHLKQDFLLNHLFSILHANNRIASSVIQTMFDGKYDSFLSIYSNPTFIHSCSLENQLLNHFQQDGTGNFWFLKALLDVSVQQSLKYYNSYKWNQLDENQQDWINEMFSLKSNASKSANGGRWNFKIPNVMDVVDRVFIGADEQATTNESSKQEIFVKPESPVQKVLPFPVTPPFNSAKSSMERSNQPNNYESAQTVIVPQDNLIQSDLPQNNLPQNNLPQSDLPQNNLPQSDLPQNNLFQSDFSIQSNPQVQSNPQIQKNIPISNNSSTDFFASENENFQSPVLKPVESPDSSSNSSQVDLAESALAGGASEKSTSYFGMLKGIFKSSKKEGSSPTTSAPPKAASAKKSGKVTVVQANLGEENTFFYDPELKAWRDRSKPANESSESFEQVSAPPPPMPIPSPASTASLTKSAAASGKGSKSRYVAVL